MQLPPPPWPQDFGAEGDPPPGQEMDCEQSGMMVREPMDVSTLLQQPLIDSEQQLERLPHSAVFRGSPSGLSSTLQVQLVHSEEKLAEISVPSEAQV